ncbi:hypothetical protein [Lentibacillus salinarum]|uniref:Uncharacterized protein n=1 Tax=Lentibacillus salinarum TaxID=446820 RepID=A0ABW3ZUZ1_9BACI
MFLKNGDEKWILIQIEVQGTAEEDFGKRMFRYFYRIYDRFDRDVYALALITDHEAEHANGFHYSFHGTKVDYTYNVYNFQDQNIAKLEQSSNLPARLSQGSTPARSKTTQTHVMLSNEN